MFWHRSKASEESDDTDWLVFGPPELPRSCINCAFLRQETVDATGNHFTAFADVPLGERRMGFRYHDAIFFGRWFTSPTCYARGRDLRSEVEALTGNPNDADGAKEVIRRDRSVGSPFHCSRFHRWVPHYTYAQHFEERQMSLLSESNKHHERQINDRAHNTQLLLALIGAVTILVTVAMNVFGTSSVRIEDDRPIKVAPVEPAGEAVATSSPSVLGTPSPQPIAEPSASP